MQSGENKYGATHSATGYLYQCRYALFAALDAKDQSPDLEISVEKFDDIAFEQDDDPAVLIQTKHHVKNKGALTDSSVDLWKTLRIWSDLVGHDHENLHRLKFVLLTTGSAPVGSATSWLRVRDRDEGKAHSLLMAAASTSVNETNKAGYESFLGLPELVRESLLKRITVLDNSPNVLDVRDEICGILRFSAPKGKTDLLVERLEGWWFKVLISALVKGNVAIPVTAIEDKIDELRESFGRNSLPLDYSDKSPPPVVVAALDKRPFVQQLRLISIGNRRVEFAIRDYYRASEQRSKWAREDLLIDGELQSYEQQLIEAWEPRFEGEKDSLGTDVDSARKIAAGQALYKWAETQADFPLRTVQARFLTHGSLHILANRCMIGWHPDFQNHIKVEKTGEPD